MLLYPFSDIISEFVKIFFYFVAPLFKFFIGTKNINFFFIFFIFKFLMIIKLEI
jgi:hypothetical protein